jgi:hypothetical protein
MLTVNKNPTSRDLHWFAAAMLVGFPAVSALLYLASRARPDDGLDSKGLVVLAASLSLVGVVAGLLTLISLRTGRKLYVLWMTVTVPVGVVMSTLLLSVLYFLFLPVFSLIVRRHDPLRKRMGGASYWEDHKTHEPTLDRMRRPF